MTNSGSNLDRVLVLEMVRVTEAAAIAAAKLIGRGDEKAADAAAVEAMRTAFNTLYMDGTIVIGEGERDEAPMLYIGEKVGSAPGKGPKIDIAVDPLEGTTITAKAGPNALAVLAIAEEGCLLNAPDVYMDKLAVGPGYSPNIVNFDNSIRQNVEAVAHGGSQRCIIIDVADFFAENAREQLRDLGVGMAFRGREPERAGPAIRTRGDIGIEIRRRVELQRVARTRGNVFATLMDVVKVASLGEITDALYEVGGEYRRIHRPGDVRGEQRRGLVADGDAYPHRRLALGARRDLTGLLLGIRRGAIVAADNAGIVQHDGLAVVSPLDHMVEVTRQGEAGQAGHCAIRSAR